MIWVKRIVGTIGLLVLLAAIVVFVWIRLYGDQITQYMVQEVNQYLDTPAEVEEVGVDFFYTFPRLSVTFDNIRMNGSEPYSEELLMDVQRASFSFNLLDIWRSEYRINRLNIYKGEVILKEGPDGAINYDILKEEAGEDTEVEGSRDISLDIEEVRIRDVAFSYERESESFTKASGNLEDITLSGQFQSDQFTLQAFGDVFINTFRMDEVVWMENNDISFDQDVSVNHHQGTYELNPSEYGVDDLALKVEGRVEDDPISRGLNVEFSSEEMKLADVLDQVPEDYRVSMDDFNKSGTFTLDGEISREKGKETLPDIAISGNLRDGQLAHPSLGESISELNFNYEVTKYGAADESLLVNLEGIEGRAGDHPFTGGFAFRDINDPNIEVDFDGTLELSVLWSMLYEEDDASLSGQLVLNDFYLAGRLSDIQDPSLFYRVTTRGEFGLQNGRYSPDQQEVEYRDLQGNMNFDGNDLLVQNFTGTVSETGFSLDGYVENLISYFFEPSDELVINAQLESDKLDVEDLLWLSDDQEAASEGYYQWAFPEDITLYLGLEADRLEFQRFGASNLKGRLSFVDGTLFLDDLNFLAMQGDIALEGSLEQTDDLRFLTDLSAEINEVGLNHFFYQSYDFGQDYLSYEHLEGSLTGDVEMEMSWEGDFSPNWDQLYAIGDLQVEDGQMKNFEPLMGMASFVDQEPLRDLKFNKLENRVLIKDQKVVIPEMDIRSNALDLLLAGEHTFTNQMEYYVRLNLHQLLFGKKEDYATEFGDVVHGQDDNLFFHIVMTGHGSDPSVSLNSRKVRAELEDQIAREKRVMEERFDMEADAREEEDETNREPVTPRDQGGDRPSRTEEERENAFDKLRQRIRDF